MATNQQPSSSKAQEFPVRVPKNSKKQYSLLKFHGSNIVDFTKCGKAKIERENNLKEYKLSHDLDMMPKFGAGSEYGRDMREEARRKKYGIYLKRYNPDDQPWILKVGDPKQPKKFKGTREGGVTENSSYFVFTQCPDGAFEAQPVEEWYNFTTIDKFKTLSVEEAEEQFTRRDKTHNFWSIMAQKKVKNEDNFDEDLDDDEGKGKKKTTKKKKKKRDSLILTELDEWGGMSDDEDNDGSDSDKPAANSDDETKKKPKKRVKTKVKSKNNHKTNSDDEALEESDSVDEGHEVDYITDSDSEDEDMYLDKGRQETEKYKETGVEDEDGLRVLMESDEEEEEEKKDDEEGNDEDEDNQSKQKNKGSDSDSSTSSDSDSDPEKESDISALFLMKKKDKKEKDIKEKKKRRDSAESDRSSDKPSRSATPTAQITDKGIKRKTDSPVPKLSKKSKIESAAPINPIAASEGITEEAVRKYLMRKPMTTKDLVQKFKNTSLSKDQLVSTVAALLKRIGPEKKTIKDKLYLSLK